MLLVEENHVRTRSTTSKSHILYSHSNGGRGHDRKRRDWFSQGRSEPGSSHDDNSYFQQEDGNTRGTFRRRGSYHTRPSQQNNFVECGYCGKFGHHEKEWRKKKNESASTNNLPTTPPSPTMKIMVECLWWGIKWIPCRPPVRPAPPVWKTYGLSTLTLQTTCHMMSHEEWFCDLRTLDRLGYVETGDDTTHPIWHVGNVPLGKKVTKHSLRIS